MSCRQTNGVRYRSIFVCAWDWVGVFSNCTMGMFLGDEFGPSFLSNLAIVNRTYSRYSPSLHAVSQCEKIVVELVYSRQQKVRKDYE